MRVTDEQIISALLSTRTNAEAAETVGLSLSALYARQQKTAFREKLARTKQRALEQAALAAQRRIAEALDVVANVMQDTQNPPQVRLNAAAELFRAAMRLTETADILARLDALEAATGERGR